VLHIGRPQAELPVEFGAEVGRAVEADAIGDLRQRVRVMGAVEQHVVAPLQPPVPDPIRDGYSVELEEGVKIAERDRIAFGNGLETGSGSQR